VDTLLAVSYNRRSHSLVCRPYAIATEDHMSHLTPFPSRPSHSLWRSAVALACLMTLLTGMAAPSRAAQRSASPELPRSSPEAQGIASPDILAFVQAADEQVDMMNSFMLVRHGHVVAEGWWGPYDAQTPHFLYNSPGTYMLSAIMQKVTGMTVLDYLRPRLFDPLGFKNPNWVASPQGISAGAYGLSVRTEEIARFGQLYLQKGMWKGRQLIPKAWVEEATALQTANGSSPKSDWDQGYGYQFWRCRHNAYRGDGAFGQYCIVVPELDAVVAITSGVRDMQSVMSLVWEKLLPAMKANPLPEDATARRRLEAKLAGLTVRLPSGQPASPRAAQVSGRWYE